MTTTTLRIYSEEEFYLVKSRLVENEIHFYEILHTDSSFPGIKQSKEYGQILIEGRFDAEIIKEYLDKIKMEVRQTNEHRVNSNAGTSRYLLIGYSVIVTLAALYLGYQKYRNSEDKNYSYEWSPAMDVLTLKDKNTWEDVNVYTDANYDMNFEELVNKSRNGKFITSYFDWNEDGIYESTVLKTKNFKTIAEYYDDNDIGFSNRVIFILENNDTLRLSDENGNGFYEILKPVNSNEHELPREPVDNEKVSQRL